MNKIKKMTDFFKKAISKFTKISLLCAFGVFTVYPLGIDQNREVFIKNATIPGSSAYFPFSDFVFISVEVSIEMDDVSVGIIHSTASGVVVNTIDRSKSYILTAGHVCDPSFDQEVSSLPFTQDADITVYDYYGFQHKSTVLGIDKDHDLCLLESNDVWTDGSSVSHSIPATGEKVYAISAPHSIFSPGNALLFDGYFTGFDDKMNAFYTIPTKPGSSGGGVFDTSGNIVGIIHSAPAEFENLAISSSLEHVKEFLSHHVIFITSY